MLFSTLLLFQKQEYLQELSTFMVENFVWENCVAQTLY